MEQKKYKIIPYKEQRYAIYDLTDKLLDDANGYGYKSVKSAHKAASYKLNGGKEKAKRTSNEAKLFLKKYPQISDDIQQEMFYSFKDGEKFDSAEFWEKTELELGITIPLNIRKYIQK